MDAQALKIIELFKRHPCLLQLLKLDHCIERVYITFQRQQVCHRDVFSPLINETHSTQHPQGDINNMKSIHAPYA